MKEFIQITYENSQIGYKYIEETVYKQRVDFAQNPPVMCSESTRHVLRIHPSCAQNPPVMCSESTRHVLIIHHCVPYCDCAHYQIL